MGNPAPFPASIDNPILPGFHPDPSILRVGSSFYIATSTFEWFPGVRLHESRDLVHWRAVGYALDRVTQLDLRGNPRSGGVWAPCQSHADGPFYLVYTDVKTWGQGFVDAHNYLVTTTEIGGPWSDPIHLNSSGFGRKPRRHRRPLEPPRGRRTAGSRSTMATLARRRCASARRISRRTPSSSSPHATTSTARSSTFICRRCGTRRIRAGSPSPSGPVTSGSTDASPFNRCIARAWSRGVFSRYIAASKPASSFAPKAFRSLPASRVSMTTRRSFYAHLSHDESIGRCLCLLGSDRGKLENLLAEPIAFTGSRLYIRADFASAALSFSFSEDGKAWLGLGPELDATRLSDEATSRGLGFTGAFGALAVQDMSGGRRLADFDYFEYREVAPRLRMEVARVT